MFLQDNNVLNTEKVMHLLSSIYSERIDQQCDESEYIEKIEELKTLKESVTCLPFHQPIPEEVMAWVHLYFEVQLNLDNYYDFRHFSQRCFLMALEETIQTLEYEMHVEDKINQIDISPIMEQITR